MVSENVRRASGSPPGTEVAVVQKRILIIDDEPSVIESLSAALAPPYCIAAASNGETGLSFLERERADLIILDLVLGSEDGVDLLPHLRRRTPAPILVLTGFGTRENPLRLLWARPDGFLEKPIPVPEIRHRVGVFLEPSTPEVDPLERVRAWIASEFHRPLTTEDLVRAAGMSRAHFCRTFLERFGLTPRAYLERCRMQRAAALLRDTEDPIKQVIGQVGFRDANNFSTAFKRFHGCSPELFRTEREPSSEMKMD